MFDIRGNLTDTLDMTLATFEETFVSKWTTENSTRPAIFQIFDVYLKDFRRTITPAFEMWIDGSFLNIKNDRPQDIDFVVFIDYKIYSDYSDLIDKRFGKYRNKETYNKLLDAHVLPQYPENHKDAFWTQSDKAFWIDLFGRTRPDRQNRSFSKGFIKIKFRNNG